MKYLVTFLSAFVIEICSTFYINFVATHNVIGMIFFAAISPWLSLPFLAYVIESNTWLEKIRLAFYMSIGYMVGSFFVIYYLSKFKL
jgi:hypothetical protein